MQTLKGTCFHKKSIFVAQNCINTDEEDHDEHDSGCNLGCFSVGWMKCRFFISFLVKGCLDFSIIIWYKAPRRTNTIIAATQNFILVEYSHYDWRIKLWRSYTVSGSKLLLGELSQPNNSHNPNSKTTKTVVVLLGLRNRWKPATIHHHPTTNSKRHDRAEMEQYSEKKLLVYMRRP